MVGVRRVVGDDAIDRAVYNSVDNGLRIFGSPQWWVHLEVRVVIVADALFGQEHMMRRHFAGDFDAVGFAPAYEIEAMRRG